MVLFPESIGILRVFLLVSLHFVDGRIAYIINMVAVLLFIVWHFERQDGEQQVDVALNVADAMFLPCPELRSNVIDDGYRAVLLDEARYLEIEAWVIDQYQHVGLPLEDVLLAMFHASKYGREVFDDRPEAHVGEVAIMLDKLRTLSCHHVSAEATEPCRRIFLLDGAHQVARMNVATCLTCYDVISHSMCCSLLLSLSSVSRARREQSCRAVLA